MASKYWLKLYHEMIDDPKVARLPDSSYRRFIECLLLAGELDEDGYLPPVEAMAWRLRLNETTLAQDLSRLALAGLVEIKCEDGCEHWFVTKFAERQAKSTDATRMKEYRKRKKRETEKKEKTDQDLELDTDIDTDIERSVTVTVTPVTKRNAFSAYSNEIGSLTKTISDSVSMWVDDVGEQWVIDAINEAALQNKRNWAYAQAILQRWQAEGKQSFSKDKPAARSSANGHANGRHEDSSTRAARIREMVKNGE